MKIIVDAMGGDNAPVEIIKGALLAKEQDSVELILVGKEGEIRASAAQQGLSLDGVEVVNAEQVITMEDAPAEAVRQKKDSSMAVALRLLAEGQGDGVVSAGSTGALLVGATLHVKRIKGIRRSALTPVLPTKSGGALLIDSGANVECTPEYLLQFAFMGHHYAKLQMGLQKPRIGLINIGTEETKGTDLQKGAYRLLKEASDAGAFRFVGNIEGRDIALGGADVLICDGFTGNIVLKTYEGVGLYFVEEMKNVFYASTKGKLAALMVKPGLRAFKNKLDYKEVGGAPLLGIAKPVVKAHGSSDARSFLSAIRQLVRYAGSDIIADIANSVQAFSIPEEKKTEN